VILPLTGLIDGTTWKSPQDRPQLLMDCTRWNLCIDIFRKRLLCDNVAAVQVLSSNIDQSFRWRSVKSLGIFETETQRRCRQRWFCIRKKLTPVARETAWLALIEEILETIGGILMSTDVIWLSPGIFEVAVPNGCNRVSRKLDRVRCCWNWLLLLMARQVLFSQCDSRKNQGQRSWFRYRRYFGSRRNDTS
jgi:hypothetical protein